MVKKIGQVSEVVFEKPVELEERRTKAKTQGKSHLDYKEWVSIFKTLNYSISYNEVRGRPMVNGEEITNNLANEMRFDIMNYCSKNEIKAFNDRLYDALFGKMCYNNSFDPIEEFFNNCHEFYLSEPNKYNPQAVVETLVKGKDQAWVNRCVIVWMAGVIRRSLYSHQNYILTLSGFQGQGKGKFAEAMCPMGALYFGTGVLNVSNKDHLLRLSQKLVIEMAELGATMNKSDLEAFKSVITLSDTDERAAYDRYSEMRKARASFVGTTNETQYLRDVTGNRRFLSPEVTNIDDKALIQMIESNSICKPIAQHGINWLYGWCFSQIKAKNWDTVQLSKEEWKHQEMINESHREESALEIHLEQMLENNTGSFLSSAQLLDTYQQQYPNTSTNTFFRQIKTAMRALGYDYKRTNKDRGYLDVRFKAKYTNSQWCR